MPVALLVSILSKIKFRFFVISLRRVKMGLTKKGN